MKDLTPVPELFGLEVRRAGERVEPHTSKMHERSIHMKGGGHKGKFSVCQEGASKVAPPPRCQGTISSTIASFGTSNCRASTDIASAVVITPAGFASAREHQAASGDSSPKAYALHDTHQRAVSHAIGRRQIAEPDIAPQNHDVLDTFAGKSRRLSIGSSHIFQGLHNHEGGQRR